MDAVVAAPDPGLEQRVVDLGREIFALARRAGPGDGWLDRTLMDWGMRDERVKAQLFRLVDVLPALKTSEQVTDRLRQYLGQVEPRLPWAARGALMLVPRNGPLGWIVASLTLAGVGRMARRFIAAEDAHGAIDVLQRLRQRRQTFTVDLLGEAVLSASEAQAYQAAYIELINVLGDQAANWSEDPLLDRDHRGRPLPRVNVSIKLSSLYSQFDPIDPEGTSSAVRARLRPILAMARQRGVFVNFDMEQYAYKDLTLRIFREILSETAFADWPDVGIAIQAYLRDSGDDLRMLADWARRRGTPVWIRLVKGAYWDFETIIARQNEWPIPVWSNKARSDANFEAQSAFLIENHEHLRPALGTHNIRSIAAALACAERHGLPAGGLEFQLLYGMADPIKQALVQQNQRVRVYAPVGAMLPGMAYFVRRLLENTSNESFLRAGFLENVPEEKLLMNPLTLLRSWTASHAGRSNGHDPATATSDLSKPFVNEPLADFSRDHARRDFAAGLQSVQGMLGRSYPLMIDGEQVETGQWIESPDPSHKQRIVGRCARALPAHAADAIEAARRAFPAWRGTPVAHRANLLVRIAQVLRRRRFEMAAWQVIECGKPWREADGDVAEAIDYCEFYARQALKLGEGFARKLPGEENLNVYEPRGVAVVIAPWNFPLAIPLGMTLAAVVTGNTAVLKPSEQASVVAAKMMGAFIEAGLPRGVVNLVSGVGEEIGPALVNDPGIALIAFTGSRGVGLQILQQAGVHREGQAHIKRIITELGGKNAIIIDEDADLDEAVHGIVASAFGYAGQKCSACSRVIALASVHDALLARLKEATASIRLGPAQDPASFLGPVIDADAYSRINNAIARAKAEFRTVFAGDPGPLAEEGFYIAPHIFADVPPGAWLAQEEIFGPVLAVLRAEDLDEALEIANGTTYALTGGLYSRNPASIERVRRDFAVGNLYINRKITGALVDRQPFGGFKLSGVGSKAGGPDYLLQFTWPRTITENTLRRGFAPVEDAESDQSGGGI